MIFESHAHYDDSKFDDDREELLSTMQENGIEKIINIGCSIESCKSTLELTKQYPFVYGAMGIHPSDIGDLNEDTFLWLREQVKKEKWLQSEKSDWTITGTRKRKYKKISVSGSGGS